MEEEYLLNTGSRMRVAICKDCKVGLKDDDQEKIRIMDCVFKGWEQELKNYSHWSEEKKKNHLEKYSKKKIVARTGNKGKDFLQKELNKFNEQDEKKSKGRKK
jgi:hypothetical protein